jgi:hypothetical protein
MPPELAKGKARPVVKAARLACEGVGRLCGLAPRQDPSYIFYSSVKTVVGPICFGKNLQVDIRMAQDRKEARIMAYMNAKEILPFLSVDFCPKRDDGYWGNFRLRYPVYGSEAKEIVSRCYHCFELAFTLYGEV